MSEDPTSTKLNPENHLLLVRPPIPTATTVASNPQIQDQPLLRLPHELARRNFKSVQRVVEREKEHVLPALRDTANASLSDTHSPDQTLAALDSMLSRMHGLKRKMETLQDDEKRIQTQSRKRIQHLEALHAIPGLGDVKYDNWSRTRLDRLLIDHMLRSGYSESAKQLAAEKGIEELVDLSVFVQCQRIAESLRRGETKEALQWCGENKAALKRSQVGWSQAARSWVADDGMQYNLEFELRLQQYIEMIRSGDKMKCMEAMVHAKKYLTPYAESQPTEIHRAAGLLAFPKDTKAEPYRVGSLVLQLWMSS